jgi:hypothetical protein
VGWGRRGDYYVSEELVLIYATCHRFAEFCIKWKETKKKSGRGILEVILASAGLRSSLCEESENKL